MSLLRISLRDFVIVRQLDLDFSQGFGVLSGETGAGKSILIDALRSPTCKLERIKINIESDVCVDNDDWTVNLVCSELSRLFGVPPE